MRFFREFFLSAWWPQFGLKLLHLVFADPKFFQCLLVRFLPIMFANAGEHGKGRNGDWKFALVRGASRRVLKLPWWSLMRLCCSPPADNEWLAHSHRANAKQPVLPFLPQTYDPAWRGKRQNRHGSFLFSTSRFLSSISLPGLCVPYCHGIIIKRVEKPGLN